MFKTIALLCATAAAASATAASDDFIPGGYVAQPVTTANVEWLQMALSDAAHDAHNGTNSICIKHVDALQTQVVAGTNYRFAVNGCELAPGQYKGYCQNDVQCGRSEFAVTIFSQPWTDTFQVTSIKRLLL